jgi:SAM-dependent methyltransferase
VIHKISRLHRAGLLGLAVKGEIGRWVSCIGESLGSQDLVFNTYIYAAFHRSGLERAPATVSFILQLYPGLRNVVDLGCGTGVFVKEFLKHNVHAEGYEYSAKARKIARDSFAIEVKAFDLKTFSAPEGEFDACICFETAHYLPEVVGDKLVKVCAESAPLVVFSSAHPKQGGYGHINERSRSYWVERFSRHGLRLEEEKTARLEEHLRRHLVRGRWFADNICLFVQESHQ